MGIYERAEKHINCNGCGHKFGMGDTINLFHLGLEHGDFCTMCKDKIVGFIQTLTGQNIPQII